jgi:hypothetical protein
VSKKNYIGTRFGRLVVIKQYVYHGQTRTHCVCDCGKKTKKYMSNLLNGKSKSCGCLRKEVMSKRFIKNKHGLCGHPLYRIWEYTNTKCNNRNDKTFKYFGQKGVTTEWKEFLVFYDWSIKNGWEHGLKLVRKDKRLGYNPSNCVWSKFTDRKKIV